MTALAATSAPRGAARFRPLAEGLPLVALVVAGVVSCYLRVPAAHLDIVWGEDAEIFLREFLQDGFFGSVFRGYAGYQHLVPRLLAGLIIPVVPLSAYPLAVFAVCAVVTGLVGAAVFWLSRDVVPWVPARIALALITFVLPLATQEVIGNLADLHSYFMWLAPWLLFSRPRSRWAAWAWAVVALLVVATEVQTVLYVLLLPYVLRRNRALRPIAAAFVLGAVWQVATVLSMPRVSSAQWPGVPSLVQGYLINVTMPMAIADPDAVRHHLQSSGFLIPVVVLIPFLLAALVCLVWGSPRQRVLAATLMIASAAVYTAGVFIDGTYWFRYAEGGLHIWERAINIRYGVSAGMLLAALVPLAAAVIVRRPWTGWRRGLSIAVASVAITGLVVVFSAASTRAVSTRGWVTAQWSYSIGQSLAACATLPGDAVRTIPIAPLREITLTCEQIIDAQHR